MFNEIRKGINAKVCLVTIAIRCTTQVQQFLINSLPTTPQTIFDLQTHELDTVAV